MGEHGTTSGRQPAPQIADLRIDEIERQIVGLTNVLGALSIGPLAARTPGPEMIGLPAAPFAYSHPGKGEHCVMAGHNSGDERARFVREHIRQRRMRADFFPADVFSDPVWDMLLDLYAAHYEGHAVSVSSLCIAAAVPATTALRWIKTMTGHGWLVRTRDEQDGRRVYVHLSDETRLKLDIYLDALQR